MAGTENAAYERAAKRVKALREFHGHVAVYLAVNALLVYLDIHGGDTGGTSFLGLNWAYWSTFGWGIAVVIQGLQVYGSGSRWEQRKIEELVEGERRRDSNM